MCAQLRLHAYLFWENKNKRLTAIILAFCILFALSACSGNNSAADGSAYPEDLITEDFKTPLGDTGAKVAIPAEMGFETYESELNEFSGGSPNGEWRIVVNTDPKSDYPEYTLEVYADLLAQSNGAVIEQDGHGNCFLRTPTILTPTRFTSCTLLYGKAQIFSTKYRSTALIPHGIITKKNSPNGPLQ